MRENQIIIIMSQYPMEISCKTLYMEIRHLIDLFMWQW